MSIPYWPIIVVQRDGYAAFRLGGREAAVVGFDGNKLALQEGWSLQGGLGLGTFAILLRLHHVGGQQAIWVTDNEGKFISDLSTFKAGPVTSTVAEAVQALAHDFGKAVFADPLLFRRSVWADLQYWNATCLAVLADLFISKTSVHSLHDLKSASLNGHNISLLGFTAAHLEGWLNCNLTLDGIIKANPGGKVDLRKCAQIDTAFLIGRSGQRPAYLCDDRPSRQTFILDQTASDCAALFFPHNNVLLTSQAVSLETARACLIRALDYCLSIATSDIDLGNSDLPGVRIGLLTSGILNFGHVIWDEMQALDRALSWGGADIGVLFVRAQSGLDLFGSTEDLYPELAGKVFRAENERDIFARALHLGVPLVLRDGQRAKSSSRKRIQRLVKDTVSHSAIDDATNYVTFGIRLSNRYPVTMMAFYLRLALELISQLGNLTVVLDGINGDGKGGTAANIYNGDKSSNEPGAGMRAGKSEIQVEEAWTQAFAAALKSSGVQLIDCIGMPILENLYWIQRSGFFVAPLGGGLAKYRWASDVPGFVLASQTNLSNCTLLHAYDDISQMDEPFTPLYMNTPEEVRDLPLDPPREFPAVPHGIHTPTTSKLSMK